MIPAGRNICIIAKGVFQNTSTFAIFKNLEGFWLCQSYSFIFNKDHVDEISLKGGEKSAVGSQYCHQPLAILAFHE